MVNSSCPKGHSKKPLCCKLEQEFGVFYDRRHGTLSSDGKQGPNLEWFCHIDDDMYLLPRNLEMMLSRYDASKLHFIGPSNLWPDLTLHKTPDHPRGTTSSGLKHPCNGRFVVARHSGCPFQLRAEWYFDTGAYRASLRFAVCARRGILYVSSTGQRTIS